MAAVYVGERAVVVEKVINRLPDTKKDALFNYCGMNDIDITNLRRELVVHGDNRHTFAHLGKDDIPENKIQRFNSELLKKRYERLRKIWFARN